MNHINMLKKYEIRKNGSPIQVHPLNLIYKIGKQICKLSRSKKTKDTINCIFIKLNLKIFFLSYYFSLKHKTTK